MAIRDIFKVSRKTFINPREWFGFDLLKDQARTIKSIITDAAAVQKPERTETFAEAMQRLELSENDLQASARNYFIYALVFAGIAFIDLIYGLYLLFYHGSFSGLILALAVCALLLAQAFRYHFWYFQIKQRKLGCTFEEWRDYLFGNKRKAHE